MCKIDKILITKSQIIKQNVTPQNKGLSYNHIRHNTDIIFTVAKKLELPLDVTLERMREFNGIEVLDHSFRNRKKTTRAKIAAEISSIIAK